jgi:hypothetical protein
MYRRGLENLHAVVLVFGFDQFEQCVSYGRSFIGPKGTGEVKYSIKFQNCVVFKLHTFKSHHYEDEAELPQSQNLIAGHEEPNDAVGQGCMHEAQTVTAHSTGFCLISSSLKCLKVVG